MNAYQPNRFSVLPEVVKNLLIINGLLFLAKITLIGFGIDLDDLLGLHYFQASKFEPYQLLTYLFMHGNFSHLFFNMFAVWMFGSALENRWGAKRFLTYYLITGLGAAFIHYTIVHFEMQQVLQMVELYVKNPSLEGLHALFENGNFKFSFQATQDVETFRKFEQFKLDWAQLEQHPSNSEALAGTAQFFIYYIEYYKNLPLVVGASGSLFGLLMAYGMTFPDRHLYMMFIPFPIKAKYFVIGYGLIELISGIANNPNDNVAHFAHLGGMFFGYITLSFWKRNNPGA